MKFRKIQYGSNETNMVNVNISKRVEYFLHYWNFLFQKNSGLLFIHYEKIESHRSLIHKIELQINENKSKYAKRIESLVIVHPYFQEDNLIIRNSPKAKSELMNFKNNFITNKTNQSIIKAEFEKIKKNVLRNYLNRLLKAVITQLVTDKPIDKTFKKDIQFLINAVVVELYHHGFSIDYIRKIADVIVFPKEHRNQFPYDKAFHNFENVELYKSYKEQTLKKINLHEQIVCIKNFVDNKKYPKQKGFCVFKIDDFDFQLKESIEIWGVTFYSPQRTRKVKTKIPENENIEIDFNHLVFPKQNNLTNSTCNAIIKVDYRIFDWNNPVIAINQVVRNVDKALQVLKRLKLDFVNGESAISGKLSTKNCIFTDYEYNYRQFVIIQFDNDSFQIKEYQKSVFKAVLNDIKLYQKNQKLMDICAYLCQAKTDEFNFNFKDYWTVLAEANFPNNHNEFIKNCKTIFRNELPDRLFMDTKVFLNNSFRHIDSEYSLKRNILKKIGLNIPENKSFTAEKFKLNYGKLKKHIEFEFFDDILAELDECQNKPEKFKEKIDKWLDNTIWSAYAERNLESHNNIVTDYSLIKLKDEFLYIGGIFLRSRTRN
jgi:hypothetical protein